MKKIVKTVIGVLLTVVFTAGFVFADRSLNGFNNDNYSETFQGAVSERLYYGKTETAKAFVTEELSGTTSSVVYKSYSKLNDLTEKEIKALPLEKEIIEKIKEGERIAVSYDCNGEEKNINSCLLKMDGGYRYFVEPAKTGEVITNSYYKSCLNGSNYLNCTVTNTFNIRIITSGVGNESIYMQTLKFDNDLAYINQQLPGYECELYFKETNNYINVYMKHPSKNDGVFYTLSEINQSLYGMRYDVYLMKADERVNVSDLTEMEQVAEFIFALPVDASYFVKTDYGFKMPNEKYKEVCKLMAGEEFYEQIEKDWVEHQIYFNSEYYVENGRLSSNKIVLTMINGNEVFALNFVSTFSDFNTTSIVLPGRGE